MSDALARICERKRADIAARKARRPLAAVAGEAAAAPPPRGVAAALETAAAARGVGLIAEIKKASPSKGTIRADFDPPALARAYAAGGAACLSVLTDEPWFQGRLPDLSAARAACALPVLCKDFMLDPWQAVEARAFGADAILIIMAAVDDATAAALHAEAARLGMDCLCEVHNETELERALALPARLIGVNNRNLKTLEIDMATTEALAPRVPADRVLVCESGIAGPADIARMRAAGARCFLVGEALMRQPDVEAAVRALLRPPDLTHFDAEGRAAMVDVGAKPPTERAAKAGARVLMSAETLRLIRSGGHRKGDVLGVARLAGIMAAKRAPDLIPLCHPLALTSVAVEFAFPDGESAVDIAAACKLVGRTGVEMEALTAVSVAALTIYDMCKAVDRGMRISDIRLLHKSGGKSGRYDAG